MKTPFPNAFTINKLGLAAGPFPLSIEVTSGTDGVFLLDLCPQRVIDVADVIQSYAQDTLLVFDVDHSSMERLDCVARGIQLPHVSYKPNVIAIDRMDLRALLTPLGHWEFHLLDHPGPPTPSMIERSVPNHSPNRSVDVDLPHPDFPLAQLCLHSHDDCYLRLHAREDRLPRAVLARILEIYAGTLLGKKAKPDIAEIPRELMNELWAVPLTLTFLRKRSTVDSKGVIMGFSRTKYSFQERRFYPLNGHLTYAHSTGTWSLQSFA